MNATAIVQDQDREIATLRERVEALRPKLDEAKREAEAARAALIAGETSDTEAATAQSRLGALRGAYDEVTARLTELEDRKRREAAERLAEAVRAEQLEKLTAAARAASAAYTRGMNAHQRIVDLVAAEVEKIAQARIDLRKHVGERDALIRDVQPGDGELEVYVGRFDDQMEPEEFRFDDRLREAVRPLVAQAQNRLQRAAERG